MMYDSLKLIVSRYEIPVFLIISVKHNFFVWKIYILFKYFDLNKFTIFKIKEYIYKNSILKLKVYSLAVCINITLLDDLKTNLKVLQ